MDIKTYEKLRPTAIVKIQEKKLYFHCPTEFVLWRANTILEKEPSTIEWLNSMSNEDRLLDIGANVGIYSVYAAVLRGVTVTAFEPEGQNFSILCTNIRLNKQTEKIKAYPVGITDTEGFTELHLSDARPGGSCHSVGEKVNFALQPKDFPLKQGIYSTTIDNLIEKKIIDIPTHIKIDVDGLEHKVLKGAAKTLKSDHLKSLSIELNSNVHEHNSALLELKKLGFKTNEAQISIAQRKSGTFKGVGEVIFQR
jgi:FkbM family methyltransferase